MRNQNTSKIVLNLFIITFIFFVVQPAVQALNSGWFVSVGGNHNDINGEFNGDNFLTDGNEVLVMPLLKAKNALSVFIGKQSSNGIGSWSVGYSETKFKSVWADIDFDVVHRRYTLFEIQLNTSHSAIHPYILLNLNYEHLRVVDGSATEFELGDASYYGGTIGLGFGFQTSLGKMFAISTHASRMFGGYNRAKGVSDSKKVEIDKVSASGWQIRLALNLYFTSK